MSVIIKGMKMPKKCEECRFYVEGASYCKGFRLYETDMNTNRKDDCPLVEIQPHGNLVDVDKLKRKAKKTATEAWKMKITANVETVLNQFIDWLENAQVIIERDD